MKFKHLSEVEVQQYALNKLNGEKAVIEHLEECEHCSAKARSYQLLFSEIGRQPKPAFDIDLSASVLAQLPRSKTRFSRNDLFISLLIFIALFVIGSTLYIFRKFVLNVFAGISDFFIYAILATTITIVVFKCSEMYRKYQQQMNVLNFY